MAHGRRSGGPEMNFDGLTDAVTNLVGALILLVMLCMGITREAFAQDRDPRPPNPGPGSGEKPTADLQRRINLLRAEIARVEEDVKRLEGVVPPLQKQVNELLEKARQAQPPKEEKKMEEEKKKDPKNVTYRPPFYRRVEKDQKVAFVCNKNRLYVFDLEGLNQAIKQAGFNGINKDVVLQVPRGDYNARISFVLTFTVGNTTTKIPEFELVLKPGKTGESIEEFMRPGSAFQQTLDRLKPQENVLQFMVYPDSYDALRDARGIAFQRKFFLKWLPQDVGEPVTVGNGKSGVL